MDLSTYVTQLREDLASAAAAGDEQTQRTAALLGAAIEPAARLALMNALSDLAAEVTEALGDRVVEVRLDGRDVRVAVTAAARPTSPSRSRRLALRGLRATRLRGLRRRRGRHLPRHAAARRTDQEPGRAGGGEPGHVAQLLGGAGRPGCARGPPQGKPGAPRRPGRQARQGMGAGMSEPIDFTKEESCDGGRPDRRRARAPGELAGERRRRAGAVGRRRAHRGAPRPGRRAGGAGRGAPRPGAGGMWGQGISGVLSWIGQATAGPGAEPADLAAEAVRPPRSSGRSPGGG